VSPDSLTSLLISSGVTVAGLLLLFVTNRRANRTNEKKLAVDERTSVFEQADDLNRYIDERIEKAVAPLRQKLAEFEHRDRTRTNAFIRVLRTLFVQWPKEHPAPRLHPADIADIEETIPPEWLPAAEEEAPERG
jgi:hypothetical protein